MYGSDGPGSDSGVPGGGDPINRRPTPIEHDLMIHLKVPGRAREVPGGGGLRPPSGSGGGYRPLAGDGGRGAEAAIATGGGGGCMLHTSGKLQCP